MTPVHARLVTGSPIHIYRPILKFDNLNGDPELAGFVLLGTTKNLAIDEKT